MYDRTILQKELALGDNALEDLLNRPPSDSDGDGNSGSSEVSYEGML